MRQAGQIGDAMAEDKAQETNPETNDDRGDNKDSKDCKNEEDRQDTPKEMRSKGMKLGKGKGKKPAWALAEESKETKSQENEEQDADDLLAFVNELVSIMINI